MHKHKKPAFIKARAFLLEMVDKRARPDDISRLPAIRKMALDCGVAQQTMGDAVRQLAVEGKIVVVPRGGIISLQKRGKKYDSDRDTFAAQPPSLEGLGLSRWEELRCLIAQDIRAGRFPGGTKLPLCKELRFRYGTSHATLRRALTALVNDRILERCNRRYLIRHTGRPKQTSTIVLLAQTASLTTLRFSPTRIPLFWRALEQECVRRDLQLDIRHLPYLPPGKSHNLNRLIPAESSRNPILGYVCTVQSSFLGYTGPLASHLSDLRKTGGNSGRREQKIVAAEMGCEKKTTFPDFFGGGGYYTGRNRW